MYHLFVLNLLSFLRKVRQYKGVPASEKVHVTNCIRWNGW